MCRCASRCRRVTSAADAHATASGGFLFTHRGYSGPSVLDVSHVAVRSRAESPERAQVTVQWTGLGAAEWEKALRPQGSRAVTGVLRAVVARPPRRGAADTRERGRDAFARGAAARRTPSSDRDAGRGALPWSGDEGYQKAEVTGGGVDLAEVHPRTMESRRHPGLYICGEVLDAFGPVGGYNFFWAWATGRAAGLGAAAGSAPR